jgi:hypothetical protein
LSKQQRWHETQACSKWSCTDFNSFTNQSRSRRVLSDSRWRPSIQNMFDSLERPAWRVAPRPSAGIEAINPRFASVGRRRPVQFATFCGIGRHCG